MISTDNGSVNSERIIVTENTTSVLSYSIRPLIDHPADIVYDVGTIDHNITWIPSGLCLDRYEIYRNDTLLVNEDLNGAPIVVPINGLESGLHVYRIDVYDTSDNKATDIVNVIVIGDEVTSSSTQSTAVHTTSSGELDSTLFIFLGIGVIGTLVIVIILFKRK